MFKKGVAAPLPPGGKAPPCPRIPSFLPTTKTAYRFDIWRCIRRSGRV